MTARHMIIIDPAMSVHANSKATIFVIEGKHGLRRVSSRIHSGNMRSTMQWIMMVRSEFPDADLRVETNGTGTTFLEALMAAAS